MKLITGHLGLIGNRIYQEIKGDKVGIDRNDKIEGKYDLIIHCGANTFIRDCLKNPDLAKENIDRTYEVFETARKSKCLVVAFSSSRAEHDLRNPYVLSKWFLEEIAETYFKNYGVEHIIIRPETIWGYSNNNDRVINKWIENAIEGRNIDIYGDEDKELSPLYIDEFMNRFWHFFYKNEFCGRGAYSISGQIRKAKDIAQDIITFFNSKSKVVFKKAEEFQPQRCHRADMVGNVNFSQELNKYADIYFRSKKQRD